MLNIHDEKVRSLLFQGWFGLEKEGLRVTGEGRFAHTPNPFPKHPHIVRDFCENQTEINTGISPTAEGVVEELEQYTDEILHTLNHLPEKEYLWCFSNPPFIEKETDIPIAQFYGADAHKTRYREYLSDRYGRYKMSLCGIHVNYSFGEKLLRAAFEASGEEDFRDFQDRWYLSLAQKLAAFGWIVTALTAASPVMDSSYVEKGHVGRDTFLGMASVRCSELGYWNHFAPVFDYSSLSAYVDSMEEYVKDGLISYPSELYYPIRLKPPGANSLDALREKGVNHIELRMVDLNPLTKAGLDVRDLRFIQLLLVWLAFLEEHDFPKMAQVQAVQNFKNAAHYDLKTVKITRQDGEAVSVADAALEVLQQMKTFYADFSEEVHSVLVFEEEKFLDPEKRYAWQIRRLYGDGFAEKGLKLAKERSGIE